MLRWLGVFRPRRKTLCWFFFILFFWLKAKLDYWYMPLCMCLDVRIYVFGEIIQISGQVTECVYTIRGRGTPTHRHTQPHTRTRAAEKFIALPPFGSACFRYCFSSASSFAAFLHPVPFPFTLSGYCSCHTSQVSFICNNFSFYTLYS